MSKFSIFLLPVLIVLSFASVSGAQPKATYNTRFLGAKAIEAINEREVLALFEITAANQKDFPSVSGLQVKYRFGNGTAEQIVRLGNDVRLMVFGANVEQKSPLIYNYVKDKIDLTSGKPVQILAFYIKVPQEDEFERMTFSYGLLAKNNPRSRVDQKYEFEVER